MTAPAARHPFVAIERLAKRVLAGEVVFFVGAGFSLDSEGNSAERLIARLLARLLAMGTCLAERPIPGSQARVLLEGLGRVFRLADAVKPGDARLEPARCMSIENVRLLARDYYNFNEWSVSALGVLSGELVTAPRPARDGLVKRIHRLETFLLASLDTDPIPLEPLEWRMLGAFRRHVDRGKALFLDTMGFANERIMGGAPTAADIAEVAASYRGRLRSRHMALARLAREGLASVLVTTNYDLLLEGAYRLAGLVEREATAEFANLPSHGVPRYKRIAGAEQFFTRGDGYKTALLLKVHGDVASYRLARDAARNSVPRQIKPWAGYLPALVFTYREIQTWRADAWSRDLIRTLLRTRTLVLCGYSGADPVMHSTFREVYEEMAGVTGQETKRQPADEDAPIFFFDLTDRREFHSFEILRAASEAGGAKETRALVEHPNHVEFHVGDGFPQLDDHFRWLMHNVVRTVQADALRSRLRRLAPRFLGNPCPDADHRLLCDAFDAICRRERELMHRPFDDPRAARRAFDAIVGWTWHFVPGLLRELALAELVESRRGTAEAVSSARSWPWYFATSERPEWTAWAAVLEIALRRMVAQWRHEPESWARSEWLMAEESPHAAVSFALGGARRQPRALCIRLAGFDREGRTPAVTGAFRGVTYWELADEDVPWPVAACGIRPSGRDLWQWALGIGTGDAAQHLGEPNGLAA